MNVQGSPHYGGLWRPFYDLLLEWNEFSPSAIYLGEHLDNQRKLFPPRGEDPMKQAAARVIPDPKIKWQMAVKLIELHKMHLQQLLASNSLIQSTPTRAEPYPRYFAAACRDSHRAVDRFLDLLEKNL